MVVAIYKRVYGIWYIVAQQWRILKIYGRLKGQSVMGRKAYGGPGVSYCAYIMCTWKWRRPQWDDRLCFLEIHQSYVEFQVKKSNDSVACFIAISEYNIIYYYSYTGFDQLIDDERATITNKNETIHDIFTQRNCFAVLFHCVSVSKCNAVIYNSCTR